MQYEILFQINLGSWKYVLFISQPRVGVATSFSLSQMGIIISTLGGILILGERKTKRQLTGIVVGIVLLLQPELC